MLVRGLAPPKCSVTRLSFVAYILQLHMAVSEFICFILTGTHASESMTDAHEICSIRASNLAGSQMNFSAHTVLQEDDTMPDDVHLIKEIRDLRARRLLRTLAVVQDLSDALMAINDVTGSAVQQDNTDECGCCIFSVLTNVLSQHVCMLASSDGSVLDSHSPKHLVPRSIITAHGTKCAAAEMSLSKLSRGVSPTSS